MAQIPRQRLRRTIGLVAFAVAVTAEFTACTPADHRDVSISVSPSTALLDAPVTVTLRGLTPAAKVRVTATATDASRTTWSAWGEFRATEAGTLSLGQAPQRGSYHGANPMGLFQFMTPDRHDGNHAYFQQPVSGSYDVTLRATVDGKVVATGRARRESPAEAGVTAHDLRVPTDSVYGTLYRPADTNAQRPAVLVFGGSEGAIHPVISLAAALLAARGYPTLALAYFKEPGAA